MFFNDSNIEIFNMIHSAEMLRPTELLSGLFLAHTDISMTWAHQLKALYTERKKTFLSAQVSVATVKQKKKKKKNKAKVGVSKSTFRYYFQDVFHFKGLFEEVLETLFLSCSVLQKIFLEKCLIKFKMRSQKLFAEHSINKFSCTII